MRRVVIIGVGMTQFGKRLGVGLRRLTVAAVEEALADAGIGGSEISRIYFGNAVAGIVSQQESVRGQVALRGHPLGQKELINIENACASGGSAFKLAYETVASGLAEVVLAIGAEQLNHKERWRPFNALRGSTDIEEIGEAKPGEMSANSILMDFYAGVARNYLDTSDATLEDFARVAVKNRTHAMRNPRAHLREPQTLAEVLSARMVVPPLTLPMCSPTTDGAAAIIVASEAFARRIGAHGVEIVTSQIASGAGGNPVGDAAKKAYGLASLGPKELDIIELHDAAAPAELLQYREIGLCAEGEEVKLIRSGETALGGRIPVNVSGGLMSRGHALGATGCAQIVELVTQLRGRAESRQVEAAKVGMAINGGGWLDGSYVTSVATILRRAQ